MWITVGYCLLSYYFGFYTFAYLLIKPEQKLLTDYTYEKSNKKSSEKSNEKSSEQINYNKFKYKKL